MGGYSLKTESEKQKNRKILVDKTLIQRIEHENLNLLAYFKR